MLLWCLLGLATRRWDYLLLGVGIKDGSRDYGMQRELWSSSFPIRKVMNGSLFVEKTREMCMLCLIEESALTFCSMSFYHAQASAQVAGNWSRECCLQRVYSCA